MHGKELLAGFEQGLGGNRIGSLMRRRLTQCFEGELLKTGLICMNILAPHEFFP